MSQTPDEKPESDPAGMAELQRTVASLRSDLARLAQRVTRLERGPDAAGQGARSPAAADPRGGPDSRLAEREPQPGRPFRVVVSPTAELALVAVVETGLRGIEAVRRVVGISREGDEATFELDLAADTELVEPLKATLPMSFEVKRDDERELRIELKPAWREASGP